jgi:RNA polymerase sigma factor (sigma-70 family)
MIFFEKMLEKGSLQYAYWVNPGGISENPGATPYLFACVTNICIDMHRRSLSGPLVMDFDDVAFEEDHEPEAGVAVENYISSKATPLLIDDPLENLVVEEEKEKVREGVDRLEGIFKDTVIQRYFGDLKYREVAEVLGIPEGTVKSRLNNSHCQLRNRFSQDPYFMEA